MRAAVVALLSLAALSTPTAAVAETLRDVRPCVTQHELWTTPGGLSRPQVERRWEVAGLGRRVVTLVDGPGWAYPICDRSAVAIAYFEPGFGLVGVGRVGLG